MSASERQRPSAAAEGVLQARLRVEWQAGGETRVETTRLLDADVHGAAFALPEPLELGQLVKLTLPPVFETLRVRPDEAQSETWALVWAVTPVPVPAARRALLGDSAPAARHVTRVLFFGLDVPRSFTENTGEPCLYVVDGDGRFRLRREGAGESPAPNRRRESRIHLPVEVTLEALDENGRVTAASVAITENVSLRGAAVRTTFTLPPQARVRLTCPQYQLTLNSLVRACRVGPDQVARMHLEFTDGQWPL